MMNVSRSKHIEYITLLCCLFSSYVAAQTWTVGTGPSFDYHTIKDAVNSSSVVSGDTILLNAAETFSGPENTHLIFGSAPGRINKNLTFDSIDSTVQATIELTDYNFCLITDTQYFYINNIRFIGSQNAITAVEQPDLRIVNCTFNCNTNRNLSITAGGAIISCCRFNGHTSSLYIEDSTCSAINNWWGSNDNPVDSGIISLTGGTLAYSPWIVMTTQVTPLTSFPGQIATVQTDFLHNINGDTPCPSSSAFNGIPVTFSATGGSVYPIQVSTTGGVASANFLPVNVQSQVCATADNGTSCTDSTIPPFKVYRINWGCKCTDTDTENILFGSYIAPGTTLNTLKGWSFNSTQCSSLSASLPLAEEVINNVAVYNKQDSIYIAMITATEVSGPYNLKLTSYKNSAFTHNPPHTYPLVTSGNQPSPTYKVQWIPYGNNAYVAVDSADSIRLYPIDLSSMTAGIPVTTPNLATGHASSFLYWLSQPGYLYLVQGFNFTQVATYRVNLATPSIQAGVLSDISSDFSYFNTCATCFDYFVIGGTKDSQGILIKYGIDSSTGKLKPPSASATLQSVKTVYYIERCCCSSNDHLLVGTDAGLVLYDANSLTSIGNIFGDNREWVNVAWCCGADQTFCSAVRSAGEALVLQDDNGNLIDKCPLP